MSELGELLERGGYTPSVATDWVTGPNRFAAKKRYWERRRRPGDPMNPAHGEAEDLAAQVGDPNLSTLDKFVAAAGLTAVLTQGKVAQGKRPSGWPHETDKLGYYSQALEAAKRWPQPKGTPEQVRNYLKQRGVKDAEINATGLGRFLEKKADAQQPVTRQELAEFLRHNRVEVREKVYGGDQYYTYRNVDEVTQVLDRHGRHVADISPQADGTLLVEGVGRPAGGAWSSASSDVVAPDMEAAMALFAPTKWSQYSLDPSNPTYRETVIYLAEPRRIKEINDELVANYAKGKTEPNLKRAAKRADELRAELRGIEATRFEPTHNWPEHDKIAHARTSLQKDSSGKPVFLIDELQSDWGQKLREGGVRDEGKIAELHNRLNEAIAAEDAANSAALHELARADNFGYDTGSEALRDILNEGSNWRKAFPSAVPKAQSVIDAYIDAANRSKLLAAEVRTAEAATPGHPLVSTTDQWTATAMRRLIQQAIDAKAEGIALTPGQIQNERFSLERALDNIRVTPNPDGTRTLQLQRAGVTGRDASDVMYVTPEGKINTRARYQQLENQHVNEAFGRDIGERIMTGQPDPTFGDFTIEGEGLRAGGHGMRYAYDQMYPKQMEKLLRKMDPEWAGRSATALSDLPTRITSKGDDYPPFSYFPLTPRIREEAAKGLPLFSAAGLAATTLPGLLMSMSTTEDERN